MEKITQETRRSCGWSNLCVEHHPYLQMGQLYRQIKGGGAAERSDRRKIYP